MRKSLAVAIPFLSVVTVAVACSSSKPQPVAPTTTTDAGAGADAAAPDAAVGFLPPAADAGPVATGPVFFTDAGAPATQVPGLTEQAMDAAIDLAITAAAPKVAPKMDKEGQPGRATLKEGEHFAMVVTLQPNRCYSFVAFSPPGSIAQLDMKLLGVALAIEAGKSGPADKSMPGISVMGKGKDAICPMSPVAVPWKLDVAAAKGAGRMGVQVFSRNK